MTEPDEGPDMTPTLHEAIDMLLSTDARDAGCEETWDLIHRYCDLVLAGEDPEQHLPGVAAHLRTCGPCAYDYRSLIDLVAGEQ